MTSLSVVCTGQDGRCGQPLPAWLQCDSLPNDLAFCSEACLRSSMVTTGQLTRWLALRDRHALKPAPVLTAPESPAPPPATAKRR